MHGLKMGKAMGKKVIPKLLKYGCEHIAIILCKTTITSCIGDIWNGFGPLFKLSFALCNFILFVYLL